jgi:hypothetical protein
MYSVKAAKVRVLFFKPFNALVVILDHKKYLKSFPCPLSHS